MKYEYKTDINVLDYSEEFDNNPNTYYFIKVRYQINDGRSYMTYSHIILQPWYDEWKREYFRKFKLIKLIKKLKNECRF